MHVITGDRNRVELRHIFRGVSNNIGNNAHRRLRRIDVRIANHKLFQNIILQRTGKLRLCDSLFLCGDDVHGHDRQHGPVHGHRNRHLVQRNPVEKDFHIFN